MEDELLTILESFKYPVFRQGSMDDDAPYPETFVTYRRIGSPDHAYYDNGVFGTNWDYSVYIYSSVVNNCYSLTESIRTALKNASWIVPSKGYDIQSDEDTHIGLGLDCYFLQTPSKNN